MSLRTRFVVLFTLLAVIPLVGVGVFSYLRSIRAVETLVATQVEEIARIVARQVGDRYAVQQANLLLLADNAETQRLYAARATGDPQQIDAATATAGPYLDHAWRVLGDAYEWIELRDDRGAIVIQLGDDPGRTSADSSGARPVGTPGWLTLEEAIRDPATQQAIGTVVAAVIPDAVLPYEALETRFGSSGYSAVLDRATGQVLYHPQHAFWRRTLDELAGSDGWNVDLAIFGAAEGTFTYREAGQARVAFFESLDSPPWTVVATGSVDEFGAPFARTRVGNLTLILVLALGVAAAYTLLTRRATRSLVALTQAADRVGAGDLSPDLPEQGEDEVGRLTGAFRSMIARVRESLRQMEASRQVAAVGQFASQIAHEIRNPLTSMKLNLQGLRRDVDQGTIPSASARPIELCLREVHRLDRVVGGVLNLARPPSDTLRRCSLHAVIADALDVLREQLGHASIRVTTTLQADPDTIDGDPEALESVFMNLFLNAADAMPEGGTLDVSTETVGQDGRETAIRVLVADDGPGIPPEVRARVFDPFFSTRKDGTGLGLSLAAQVVERHRGTLALADQPDAARGAVFVIELPLTTAEEPA